MSKPTTLQTVVRRLKSPPLTGGIGTLILTIVIFFAQGGFRNTSPWYAVGLVIGSSLIIYDRIKSSDTAPLLKTTPRQASELSLTDALTAMHRRLVELQKDKASHTEVSYTAWKRVVPTLADTMGVVKLKDWRKFERDVRSRVRRALPRKHFTRTLNPKRRFIQLAEWRDEAYRVALSVALELKDELVKSRGWTFDDGIKASNWLDGYDWGVKKLRDDDPQWQGLFESISDQLKEDALRNIIQRHIEFSLMCNNMRLLTYFSSKFKDDVFSIMLHEGLVGSPISPEHVEVALSEILSDIDKRTQSKLALGGLVGKASNVKISHSHFTGRITVGAKSDDTHAGGLIGEGENTEIVESSADAEIEYGHEQD
jgi:hypothetical protein